MLASIVILVLIVAYLIYRSIYNKKPKHIIREAERVAEIDHVEVKVHILEELNKNLEMQKEQSDIESAKSTKGYEWGKKILGMEDTYSRLKLKYKNNPKTLVELAKDWAAYWKALNEFDEQASVATKESIETKFRALVTN